MLFLQKPSHNALLWWVSALTLTLGGSVYFLLGPTAQDDYVVQRYRSIALLICMLVSGLCIIIGTSKRWFGKDL